MAEFSDPYLNRIVHRSDGAGFTAYLETYLETHSARMTRTDLAIHRKALDIIHLLIVDSDALEHLLGQARAAHMAERGVSLQQALRIRDLEEEVDLLRRQEDVCRKILDSDHGMDESAERQGGPVRGGGVR
jgi:hypothetical protein